MKDKMMEDKFNCSRHIIFCNCGSNDHMVIFELYKDEDFFDSELSIYVTLNTYQNFFERLKNGLKYILGKKIFYFTDTVLISKDNISDLEEWIKEVKDGK